VQDSGINFSPKVCIKEDAMKRTSLYYFICLSVFFVSMTGIDLIRVSDAHAIPAWARKYDQPCQMCHYPAVPRLNTFGHKFRQAGFRTPDEINQDIKVENVSNYLSVRGRGRYVLNNFESSSNKDISDFRWNDTTLFYAGPAGRNFSGFAEFEWEAEDTIGLVASISGLWGSKDHFTTLRVGQFHTLSRVGFGGFDRPTGISTPSIRSANLTKDVKFTLGADQRGFEVAHAYQSTLFPERSRIILQITNGVNTAGSGTENDNDTQKDYTLAFEQILDNRASGFTLIYYSGIYTGAADRFWFQRYGGTASWVLPSGLEFQGGYIRSTDDPNISDKVNANALYLELEQYLASLELTGLVRYDIIDPDDTAGDDRTTILTAGAVRSMQEWLKVSVEGSANSKQAADTTDYSLIGEVMINF